MANLATTLKQEIARLARRSLRAEIEGMKKASAQHRRHIAALRREVAQLQRVVAVAARRAATASTPAPAEAASRIRFVAKGLRSQRTRLGLSASDFGRLAGVSAQTIYNWERESARPGKPQLARLATLRGLGKRDAVRRLAELGGAQQRKQRRARRK